MKKLLVAILSLAFTTNAFAQGQAGSSADLHQDVKAGQDVSVRLRDKSELKGTVLEWTDAQLTLATKHGPQQIIVSRIEQITWRRRDRVLNGLIIGAAGGALAGLAYALANDCGPGECGEGLILTGGIGIGAAVGAGIDSLRRSKQVVYRAPQKQTSLRIRLLAGHGATGATVSWRF